MKIPKQAVMAVGVYLTILMGLPLAAQERDNDPDAACLKSLQWLEKQALAASRSDIEDILQKIEEAAYPGSASEECRRLELGIDFPGDPSAARITLQFTIWNARQTHNQNKEAIALAAAMNMLDIAAGYRYAGAWNLSESSALGALEDMLNTYDSRWRAQNAKTTAESAAFRPDYQAAQAIDDVVSSILNDVYMPEPGADLNECKESRSGRCRHIIDPEARLSFATLERVRDRLNRLAQENKAYPWIEVKAEFAAQHIGAALEERKKKEESAQ